MLQIAYIRENKEDVVKRLNKKNMNAQEVVELVINLDEKRRSLQVELDNTLAESNKLSKDIGTLMKSGEKAKAEILKEKGIAYKATTDYLWSEKLQTSIKLSSNVVKPSSFSVFTSRFNFSDKSFAASGFSHSELSVSRFL